MENNKICQSNFQLFFIVSLTNNFTNTDVFQCINYKFIPQEIHISHNISNSAFHVMSMNTKRKVKYTITCMTNVKYYILTISSFSEKPTLSAVGKNKLRMHYIIEIIACTS